MWYEIPLPKGIGASASPHELKDKAWRMQNAVWRDGYIEDIDVPLVLLFDETDMPPAFLTDKHCHDVCRVVGYANGTNERTVITAFATETDVVGYYPNGSVAFGINHTPTLYRLLSYSLNKNIGIVVFGSDRRFFDGTTFHIISDNILERPPTPSVSSALDYSEIPIEYRYRIVYAKTDLGFVSPPSEPVGCYGVYNPHVDMSGSNKQKDYAIYLHPNVGSTIPADIDKVFIYRWTETVGVYVKIAEINVSDWWYMYAYQDVTPSDYINSDVLPDVIPIPKDPVTALGTLNGRLIYGMDNKIFISEVSKPFWMNVKTPVFVLDSPVENMFLWGSHIIVQSRFGWYRLFETENGFALRPFSLPLPATRTAVRKTSAGLIIASWRGVYVFTSNEELLHLPFNLDIIEGKRLTSKPSYVRLYRDNIDVALEDGRYFRVSKEGDVSGLHDRLRIFAWGE